jgi:hypothetical protein
MAFRDLLADQLAAARDAAEAARLLGELDLAASWAARADDLARYLADLSARIDAATA